MRNDGGAAFPRVRIAPGAMESASTEGMSLRDVFAAVVLHGTITTMDPEVIWKVAAKRESTMGAVVASRCYELADAMLAEREKESK